MIYKIRTTLANVQHIDTMQRENFANFLYRENYTKLLFVNLLGLCKLALPL